MTIPNVSHRLITVETEQKRSPDLSPPTTEEIKALLPGDLVKLILDPHERVWVKISTIEEGGYLGRLTENTIAYNDYKDSRVDFGPEHICDIDRVSQRIKTFDDLRAFVARFPEIAKIDVVLWEGGSLRAKVDIPEKYGKLAFHNDVVTGESMEDLVEKIVDLLIRTMRSWEHGLSVNLHRSGEALSFLTGVRDEEIVSIDKESENG